MLTTREIETIDKAQPSGWTGELSSRVRRALDSSRAVLTMMRLRLVVA